jgi:hypothetical protein
VSTTPNPYVRHPAPSDPLGPGGPRAPAQTGLADVLERVLDKGIVVAGDIQLNLLDIEVLTIKIRLLIASADTAQQMGVDWWKEDPFLSREQRELERENEELRQRLRQLTGGSDGDRPATDDGGSRALEGSSEELLRRLARLENVVAHRLGPVAERDLDSETERDALDERDVARTELAEDESAADGSGEEDGAGDER